MSLLLSVLLGVLAALSAQYPHWPTWDQCVQQGLVFPRPDAAPEDNALLAVVETPALNLIGLLALGIALVTVACSFVTALLMANRRNRYDGRQMIVVGASCWWPGLVKQASHDSCMSCYAWLKGCCFLLLSLCNHPVRNQEQIGLVGCTTAAWNIFGVFAHLLVNIFKQHLVAVVEQLFLHPYELSYFLLMCC